MNILVTGGAGFIGSHTARRFLERGWSVTLYDNMRRVGTAHLVEIMNDYDLLPVMNYRFGSYDEAHRMSVKDEGRYRTLIAELREQYPELKSNESFLKLQDSLEGTENRLAVERCLYQEGVVDIESASMLLSRKIDFAEPVPEGRVRRRRVDAADARRRLGTDVVEVGRLAADHPDRSKRRSTRWSTPCSSGPAASISGTAP